MASLVNSDYVYNKIADKQITVYYDKSGECLIPPIRKLALITSATNPGGPHTIWQSSVDGNLYYGATALNGGGPPPPPAIEYDELEINTPNNFTDANGVNPITVPIKLVRIGNTVHLYITEFIGALGTSRYILAPGNPIPVAWRANAPVFTTTLSFNPATAAGISNYDADINGLVRVDHATGGIQIFREAPGGGAPADWAANTGWKSMHVSWTSLAPP